jgi:hypothetical protein
VYELLIFLNEQASKEGNINRKLNKLVDEYITMHDCLYKIILASKFNKRALSKALSKAILFCLLVINNI